MKPMTIIGIILIVLGVVGLIYGGITYTSSKNVVEMGSMRVQVNEAHQIPLSPIAGTVVLAAGVVLVIAGRRQSRG